MNWRTVFAPWSVIREQKRTIDQQQAEIKHLFGMVVRMGQPRDEKGRFRKRRNIA